MWGLRLLVRVIVAFNLLCLAFCVYRNCGGIVRAPKGVVTSPNFPNEFPTPILCEWVILNRQTKFTLIHLTQFYLKSHFTVQFFQEYTNSEMYRNESRPEVLNAYHDVYTMVIPAPYAVLRFGVHEMGDINIRVLEHMTDVYGFNITYEFVNSTTDYQKETCTAYHCSYLGHCIASEDFSEYKCHCFNNFFGDYCHYGPDCNPKTKTNRCQNGGICSYLNGSLNYICECPTGYTGDWCEIKQDDCYYLGCEHLCVEVLPGVKGCQCEEGYRLGPDRKSCIAKENLVVLVRLDITSLQPTTSLERRTVYNNVVRELHLSHIKNISEVTNIRGRSNNSDVIELKFIINKKGMHSTVDLLQNITKQIYEKEGGKIVLTFSIAEELRIIDLVVGNGGPTSMGYINENGFLTISCIAKGRNTTTFQWYKDDMQIDFSISPRGGYVTTVHSKTEGTIRSVLYYTQIKKYDQGYFSCVTSDGYSEKHQSIYVSVQTTPQIYIPKRQMMLSTNASVRIPCFSINEPYNSFQYEWYENGAKIQWHTHNRFVESLLPAGTQLFAKRISQSTNFTCRVANMVGAVNLTTRVFVAKDNQFMCHAEIQMGILWPDTRNGHLIKQNCPDGFGGYAERSCYCDVRGGCKWNEPSFLYCQSNQLIKIYDKVEILYHGYRSSTISHILDELHSFISTVNPNIHVGDAELSISILRRIFEYQRQYPMLATSNEKVSFKNIIEVMDCILTATKDLPSNIKQKLTLGENILHISAYLSQKSFKTLFHFETEKETKTQTIDVKEQESRENGSSKTHGMTFTLFTFRSLDTHLTSKTSFKNPMMRFSSDLVAVYADHSLSSLEGQSMDIPIYLIQNKSKEFECVSWTRKKRGISYPSWGNASCSVVSANAGVVTCHCQLPVEVIVVERDINITVNNNDAETDIFLGIILSHAVSICGLFFCVVIIAVNWRYLTGEHYVFYTNYILVLLMNNVVFLVCHLRLHDKMIWIIGEIAVYFLYISAFTCLLMEMFHFFILTLTSKEYSVNKRCSRFIITGWGIPLVLTIFFSIVSQTIPRDASAEKRMVCWISKYSWQFQVFILPVAFITAAFLIFMAIVWNIRVKLTEESEMVFKRRLRIIFLKSLALLVLTLAESLLGMDMTGKQYSILILHFISKISLVVCVFVTRCASDGKIKHCAVRNTWLLNNNITQKKSWKQNNIDGKLRSEIDAREYYDEVNKTKYTSKRKRELSSLLGTSSLACGVRNSRTDSNGTGSSRTTNTSTNTSITNVSSDREEIIPGKAMNLKAVAERRDGMEEHSPAKGKKCLAGKETTEEYLTMHSIPRRNVNKNGETCVTFQRFENIIEAMELHQALIHNADLHIVM